MKKLCFISLLLAALLSLAESAEACTSMLVSGAYSRSGRPMMWKHRDTGAEDNFIERKAATDSTIGFVALYNGGDSLLREAWMGVNDRGFAIMNTASYNLAPDTTDYKDREGIVMSLALGRCASVADFERLLTELPRPMGVQANFGVMDTGGALAYFETYDHGYRRYDVADTLMVRTNFSVSGNDTDGMGYIRYHNVGDILSREISARDLTPESFTEKASRSFRHSLIGKDFEQEDTRWVIDRDFIPRRISSASIVIEGVNPGEQPGDITMWTVIGYPPCSHVEAVTLDNVPQCLRPVAAGWRSPLCNEVVVRKRKAFPITVGSGSSYIDMDYVRSVMPAQRALSEENYKKRRKECHPQSQQ